MYIYEGYPHTTSILLSDSTSIYVVRDGLGDYSIKDEADVDLVNDDYDVYTGKGILRYLDYHPIHKPIPDLRYADGFKKECEGIYLKWLNTQGGYSYELFSNAYTEDKIYKSLGEIQRHWRSRGSLSDNTYDLGRESKSQINIYKKISRLDMREVASLLDSPEVYMYTDDSSDCLSYTDNLCGCLLYTSDAADD